MSELGGAGVASPLNQLLGLSLILRGLPLEGSSIRSLPASERLLPHQRAKGTQVDRSTQASIIVPSLKLHY